MQLYFSQNSPFARIARIAAREMGLIQIITEFPAANRQPDNPVLRYSPVGRVPTLVDGKIVITETKNVVQYLAAQPKARAVASVISSDWQDIMQEGQILGFIDGIASWVREDRREPECRSTHLIEVERDRSKRCLAHLENGAASEKLGDFPIFRFIALAAGLDLMDFHQFHPAWRTDYPKLASWFVVQASRQSMRETAPR